MSLDELAAAVDKLRALPYAGVDAPDVVKLRQELVRYVVEMASGARARCVVYSVDVTGIAREPTVRAAFVGLPGLRYVDSSVALDYTDNLYHTWVTFMLVDAP